MGTKRLGRSHVLELTWRVGYLEQFCLWLLYGPANDNAGDGSPNQLNPFAKAFVPGRDVFPSSLNPDAEIFVPGAPRGEDCRNDAKTNDKLGRIRCVSCWEPLLGCCFCDAIDLCRHCCAFRGDDVSNLPKEPGTYAPNVSSLDDADSIWEDDSVKAEEKGSWRVFEEQVVDDASCGILPKETGTYTPNEFSLGRFVGEDIAILQAEKGEEESRVQAEFPLTGVGCRSGKQSPEECQVLNTAEMDDACWSVLPPDVQEEIASLRAVGREIEAEKGSFGGNSQSKKADDEDDEDEYAEDGSDTDEIKGTGDLLQMMIEDNEAWFWPWKAKGMPRVNIFIGLNAVSESEAEALKRLSEGPESSHSTAKDSKTVRRDGKLIGCLKAHDGTKKTNRTVSFVSK